MVSIASSSTPLPHSHNIGTCTVASYQSVCISTKNITKLGKGSIAHKPGFVARPCASADQAIIYDQALLRV